MLTKEQIESLKLGISPIDEKAILIISAGVEWIGNNTTIDTSDVSKMPASACLFLVKYFDIQKLKTGVASQSIEGLSQSFNTGATSTLVWQAAEELLSGYLKSRVQFVSAQKRWR